jgi:hypothetical protein
MRRVAAWFVVVVAFTIIMYGQMLDKEGKAWLDPNTDPPAINVTGIWDTHTWGRVSLNQREGSRRIIGAGDGWDISGVVSGKDVYLLFSNKDKIAYSAKLTSDGPSHMTGVYANGILSPRSKTRPIVMSK